MAVARDDLAPSLDLDEFVAYRGAMAEVRWDDPPVVGGKRYDALRGAPGAGTSGASTGAADSSRFGWDDVDEGPAEDDISWRAFDTAADAADDAAYKRVGGGRKLTKAQREKLRDEEQLREARESIRKRGWTENEVKWRSWLARRGHDVMVNDWNLYRHIDGECTPPSRDPFWLNALDKVLARFPDDSFTLSPLATGLLLVGVFFLSTYRPVSLARNILDRDTTSRPTWAIPDSVFIATPWIQRIRVSFGERHW